MSIKLLSFVNNFIVFICFLRLKQMKSPAVKNESQSEDIKPADWSAQPISAKKEPLVQATLSSMFKKAEEKKVEIHTCYYNSFSPCDSGQLYP